MKPSDMTPEQRKEWGRRMQRARQAKRAAAVEQIVVIDAGRKSKTTGRKSKTTATESRPLSEPEVATDDDEWLL